MWFDLGSRRGAGIVEVISPCPRDAGNYRAALDHVRQARPQTIEEVRMRAVSMVHTLAIWGEMMFSKEKSLTEIEALLR
jgi:hypothetical protein